MKQGVLVIKDLHNGILESKLNNAIEALNEKNRRVINIVYTSETTAASKWDFKHTATILWEEVK